VNDSSTLTNTTIWFVVLAALRLIVDARTYVHVGMDVQTYVCTDGPTLLPGLLGNLSGDDLKIQMSTNSYF